MDAVRLILLGLLICFFSVFLKGKNPGFALGISLAGGAALLFFLFADLSNTFTRLNDLTARLNIPTDGMLILLKCLGLSYIAKLASDTCRDCGEAATAGKIELAAKVAMITAAIPLLEQLFDLVIRFAGS